jgi:hypothetical protein
MVRAKCRGRSSAHRQLQAPAPGSHDELQQSEFDAHGCPAGLQQSDVPPSSSAVHAEVQQSLDCVHPCPLGMQQMFWVPLNVHESLQQSVG